MIIDGGWDNEPIFKALGENAGTFAIPQLSGSKYPKILAGGTNVAVSVTKYSKNKAEAIKFVKYLMLAKTIDTYVKTTQTEPSNHVNADASVILFSMWNETLRHVAEHGKGNVIFIDGSTEGMNKTLSSSGFLASS